MKNLKLNIAVFLALLIAISGCQKDDIVTEPMTEPEESQFQEGMIQLGKKLENPYTVENMRKAYQTLSVNSQLKSATVTESEIDVTHLYVRFLPKTDEELGVIQIDTTLELFDYPLDYEIQEGGTYYQDPELPDTAITWQYCAVKKDFNFPNIEYEVLAELFLPESMEDETSLKSSETWTFWDDLEVEALKITGNYDEAEDTNLKSTMGRKKWKPSGTIRVNDNSGFGLVPVVGCKARAYSWFTTKSDLTDNNGYFYINHNFKGHVNYSIKWERNNFDIRSGNWGQAYFNGPRYKQKAWNLDIRSGMSWVYAHLHIAAYDYYYNNSFGIKKPTPNNRIKIGGMDKSGTSTHAAWRRIVTFPQIKIFRNFSSGTVRTSEDLYAVTIHELAHASHWDNDHGDFNDTETNVKESWALGVEVEFTEAKYSSNYKSLLQTRTLTSSNVLDGYTPLVRDLIDNNNQRVTGGSTNLPVDRVSGYTLSQIEDAMHGAKNFDEWEHNLNQISNSTRANLAELFGNY